MTLYPRPTIPTARIPIHPVAARMLLTGAATAAHAGNGLVLLTLILMIAILLMLGRIYQQVFSLVAQYLKTIVDVGVSLLLLLLGGAALVLVLAMMLLHR